MSGGVPANTSTTTTVNQSPWQNQTYRTLALGTPGNLGPVAQQLKIGQQLTQDWQDIQSGRNPGLYYGLPNATPEQLAVAKAGQDVGFAAGRAPAPTPADTETKTAAQGGIMNLRNFASGGSANATVNPQAYAPGGRVKPKYTAKSSADDKLTALNDAVNNGYKPKPAEVTFMQGMADTAAVRQQLGDTPYTVDPKTGALKPIARGSSQTSGDYTAYLNKFGAAGAAIDPKLAKQYGAQTSAQLQQAAADRQTAANRPYSYSDLATPTAFLDPKTGQNMLADAQLAYQRARELGTPEQIGQATQAYQDAISGLKGAAQYQARDVNAQRADVYGYDPAMAQASSYQAATMNAPKDIQAQAYDAAQMNAAQAQAAQANRGDIRDIAAQLAQVERYKAAEIERTQREQAATTQGPKSWTDPGVAQQYMNPYQQAVTDQELFEANRQAQMRENQQRSQATQQKAFGGTRAALQESEGRRNLGYLLSDIQNKGSQQAYQSGMGQFSAEQGLGAQVGMSNTQQINQLKQQYMQMGLSEAQANQAAINQASQINAAAQNTAYNNYVAQQLQAQQANQAMDWNTVNLNTSNQQATNMANAQFQQQAAQANQAAINQQRSQYVTQALQAAQNNYGGQLTAAQQNQVAQNAASQFNAGNQQQINLANQASQNAASQLYANAQNQAGLQYAQQNLQGQMANQQAGLQANQQNIGAYGAMGNMAQGLGGLGATQSQINLNNLAALGQSATAQTQYAQGALDRNTQNAMNWYNLPTTFNAAGINALNAQPVSGGSNASSTNYGQAKWFNKGGKVQWGPKK